MNRFAYHFRRIRIDLSSGEIEKVPIAPELLEQTIGGTGLGVELLLQTETPELDPLDPRSSLFFVFSPLVGSPLTTSAKFAVVCKSPLTHRINDSLAGSGFAIAGKKTGFDAIEITGRSESQVILRIDNGTVNLEPCPDLWGTLIPECESRLKNRYGNRYRVACIGPAGENRVRFATISHDGRHAGRGGSGAVLGAKNVKAILVSGDQAVDWAEPDRLNRFAKTLSQRSMGPATAKYRELGTAGNLLAFNRLQCLPTRNFQRGTFEGAQSLAPESMGETRDKVRSSCVACTIGCEHIYSFKKNRSTGPSPKARLEYESLFALGPLCGIDDPDIVLEAARLCDDFGLDTISTGGTIAFAMECSEKGWIRKGPTFGNARSLIETIRLVATRKGLGDLLANGSRSLAAGIGEEAMDYAPQVKGLEIPGYDPRQLASLALGFAVGSRGADHNRSSAYEIDLSDHFDDRTDPFSDERIEHAIWLEDRAAVMDSLIFCKFLRGVFDDFFAETSDILQMATGFRQTAGQLREKGTRIVQNKKRFNLRAGWDPLEDTIPQRFFEQTDQNQKAKYTRAELQKAISAYNCLRGWTPEGFLKSTSPSAPFNPGGP
ncbi:MAG: aldehyde ferredoxin oxidoreductase family protein [Planctomycetota bacterium]|nr:aldehyde ferredoxin oxidoreductase family protein [Planctomycetota bacterium]